MTLKIFTTSRQIRKWLEEKDNEFLDKFMTLGEFLQKIVVVDDKKFIDKDLRKKYLFEAIKGVDVHKLGINRNFLEFFNDSEFLFSFFNELFLERVDIKKVQLSDVYLDYDEHLSILEEILKNYKTLLEKDGYIDRFLIEDFRINEGLLEGIEKIELRLDGYLSKFDLEVLEKIDIPIFITFETDKFNLPLLQKSLKLSLKPNRVYEYELKSAKLKEFKKTENNAKIEIGYVSDRINQINYVFSKIMEFSNSKIPAENIAVILPDEEFSEFLKLFDEKKNLNFAMGESFSKSSLYIKLKSIFEYLSGDDEAYEKCFDVMDDFRELDLIEFIKKHANDKEKRVIEEELFKIEKFRDFFEEKKDFLYFVLEKLKELKFDDVYSGLVTCMGVLESRGMEFDGVIIVDFNEDIVPNVSDSDLFLNTFIRKQTSLPTRFDRENLQKHYYYQLISKAKKVAISFTKNEENSPSRFLYDLMPQYEKELVNIDNKYQNAVLKFKKEKEIAKYDEEFEIKFPLYPTQLKTLIECPKKYYFSKVLEIVNEEDEEEFFGNIFHNAMDEVVKNKEKINTSSEYYHYLIDEITKRISDKKLLFDVLVKWDDKIKEFCKLDFEEMKNSTTLPEKRIEFEYKGVKLAARVDRIDLKNNEVILIDYKTSKSAQNSENYPFELQTTFYYLWAKQNFNKEIKTVIWDIYNGKKIDGVIKLEVLDNVLENLPKRVKEAEDIVYKIGNKEKVKRASDICRYCEYKIACGREE